jgi:hypothetical protein
MLWLVVLAFAVAVGGRFLVGVGSRRLAERALAKGKLPRLAPVAAAAGAGAVLVLLPSQPLPARLILAGAAAILAGVAGLRADMRASARYEQTRQKIEQARETLLANGYDPDATPLT